MNELEEGIAALRTGERAKARALIANVLRYDVDNLIAWQWMHNAVESNKERKFCIEQILRLRSGN